MSNSQITSQLTRVTVPSISDGKFVEGIGRAFETINNNFKTIASLPFIQGVQGDSYTLISKDIWVEVNDNVSPVYYALTKEGAVLLNSIFESALVNNTGDAIKFQEGDSFDECKTNKLGNLSLNGVSPIDSFFTEENDNVKLVNNKLYFYSIINNLDEEQDTYLGQYFYFIDARITELGSVYGSEGLSEFNDFTGFYQYQPSSDTEAERYNAISIVPNLYYDKYKDDICWKYNGQETGISAIGPKGLDGKDANFLIIFVSNTSETANSGNILGYYNFNEDEGKGGITFDNSVKDCFCLIQFVSTTNENGKIVITEYIDSAFGEVHSNKAYWEDEYRISKLFNNQNITRYFCSMGDKSSIENHPYYFAIPSYRDRTNSSKSEYTYGHVLLSSDEGDLVLQKSENAFTASGQQNTVTDNGQQEETLRLYTDESDFNIRNYNVNIGYDTDGNRFGGNLTVVGSASTETLSVSGSASIGDLDVDGTASIKSLEVSDGVTVTGDKDFNVNLNTGTVSLKSGAGYGITFDELGTMEINTNDLIINGGVSMRGSLGVTGSANIDNGLTVSGGLQVETKKADNIDFVNGTADGKSNVLFGHNNPGNSSDDFPLEIEKAGYPLVIRSVKKDGTPDPNTFMVFGDADIYAIKKDTVNGKDVIVPGTLCLQDRSNYFGDVLIGRNLKIGDYTKTIEEGGTGGNLIINAPYGTSGNDNKAIIIRKSNENTDDYRGATDKLTIFSNGDIDTEGSATIGGDLLVTGSGNINSLYASGDISCVGITASGDISCSDITASGRISGIGGISISNGGNITSTFGKIIIPTTNSRPTIENGLIIKNNDGSKSSTLTVDGSQRLNIDKGIVITDGGAIINDGNLEVNGEEAGINVTGKGGYIRGCNKFSFTSAWSYSLGTKTIYIYDDINKDNNYTGDLRALGRASSVKDVSFVNNYYVANTSGAYVFPSDFPKNAVVNLFAVNDRSVDIIRDIKTVGSEDRLIGHTNRMTKGSHATIILADTTTDINYYEDGNTKTLSIRLPQYIFYTGSTYMGKGDDSFS